MIKKPKIWVIIFVIYTLSVALLSFSGGIGILTKEGLIFFAISILFFLTALFMAIKTKDFKIKDLMPIKFLKSGLTWSSRGKYPK